MDLAEFDFDLPTDLIAQEPPADRGGSRLLVLDRRSGDITHRRFQDLPSLLRAGDLLVVNDTKVFPARLLGTRLPGGGAAECLLVRRLDADIWECLVHPGQRLRAGSKMVFERGGHTLHGEVLDRHFHGRRSVRFTVPSGAPLDAVVDAIGHVPLPPYIKRDDRDDDRERYQTVYARQRGSIAAPTAGLHFTPAVLDTLAQHGVERTSVTLHVGYGTFQPVRVERIEDHQVEAERYEVSPSAAAAIERARQNGRRIIAVGTTTVRTLESQALRQAQTSTMEPGAGDTNLFIHPGHEFRVVTGLITNFHLPRSSLLMLVAAFAGRDHVLAAYRAAVAERYRFYSYGDAMLII
jgi:S-adenosylmethionine:tRNA ribosyltransferase-isomerase